MGIYNEVKSVRRRESKLPDKAICPLCSHAKDCTEKCYPLTWINGDVGIREKLAKSDLDSYENGDYNGVLAEQIEHKRRHNRQCLEDMPYDQRRAVVVLLDDGFKIAGIARIFRCSEKTIYRASKK